MVCGIGPANFGDWKKVYLTETKDFRIEVYRKKQVDILVYYIRVIYDRWWTVKILAYNLVPGYDVDVLVHRFVYIYTILIGFQNESRACENNLSSRIYRARKCPVLL